MRSEVACAHNLKLRTARLGSRSSYMARPKSKRCDWGTESRTRCSMLLRLDHAWPSSTENRLALVTWLSAVVMVSRSAVDGCWCAAVVRGLAELPSCSAFKNHLNSRFLSTCKNRPD